MNKCVKIYKDGEIKNITESDKEKILNKNSNMADKALRVIAVSYLDLEILPNVINSENIEKNLIFVRNNSE